MKIKEDTYWNNKGLYQVWYDENFNKLVPSSGKADTLSGELLRAISKVYYDSYNNGNMNNTSGPVNFLLKYSNLFSPEIVNYIRELYLVCNCSCGQLKDNELERVTNAVIEYAQNEKNTASNVFDMYDYEDADYIEEFTDEYYEDYDD